MRDPSRILQVLNDRGRRGLGVNKIYKHLCSPELVLAAWAAIYDNDGALTAGVDPADTAEGMSMEVIEDVCALLRSGRYFPKAVRRTHIPKKNGKLRPLGLPGFPKRVHHCAGSCLQAAQIGMVANPPQELRLVFGTRPENTRGSIEPRLHSVRLHSAEHDSWFRRRTTRTVRTQRRDNPH